MIGGTGDGKTLHAVMRIFEHLDRGGVAACNFHFKDGWAWRMAQRSYDHTVSGKPLAEVARSFWQRLFLCGSPETIEQFSKLIPKLVEGPVANQFDRKALVILDEGHFYIQPQNYRDNGPWLRIFNQQRKLKLHCILITNDPSFLDNKIRKLFKVIIRCINLHEHWRIPGTDICWPRPDWRPNIPRPSYIIRRWSTLNKGSSHANLRRHQPWLHDLYDTDEVFDYDSLPTTLDSQGLLGDNPFAHSKASGEVIRLVKQPFARQRDTHGCCTLYDFSAPSSGVVS
jgi:hypothetical protein